MEDDKILKELKAIRKDIKGSKGGQYEGTAISVMSLFLAIGMSLFLYFVSLLNEALNVKVSTGTALFFVIVGIFMMFGSIYIPAMIYSKRKKR